jgi:predicted SPOUT superfamily RNA methylase MTH1
LSPLATPHHIRSKELQHNEIRESVIYLEQGRVLANVGGSKPIEVINSPKKSLKNQIIRTTTKIWKTEDEFKAIILQNPPTDKYWGYSVSSSAATLGKVLQNYEELKIATSRSCQSISSFSSNKWKNKKILIAFGGPYKGIPEMVKAEGKKVSDLFDCCYNILSKYGTRSLRLEEAMMITLSKLEDRIGSSFKNLQ